MPRMKGVRPKFTHKAVVQVEAVTTSKARPNNVLLDLEKLGSSKEGRTYKKTPIAENIQYLG